MAMLYPIASKRIDNIYGHLCSALLSDEATQLADTRELNNVMIKLLDINNNIVSIRGLSPSYLFGELIWYFAGAKDLKFISQFSKFWEKISDDGETCNSAYGYLMKRKFGFNQINKVIELLKKDPSSRRAKININTPNENVIETKDEPCTMFLQFMIRDGKLDCTAVMRSNDIWLGFPYDVAFFTELQKYIARELEVQYGTYTHFAVSMHLYERNIEAVNSIVWDNPVSKPIKFDGDELVKKAHTIYMALYYELCEGYISKVDIKKYLFALLDVFDIYKGGE